MNGPPKPPELAKLWVEKAENDYKAVQNLLKMGGDCPFDVVCFLAQQCIEKYLKSRLVYLSIEFPKTHEIEGLIKRLPPGLAIPLTPAEQEKMTNYAWMGRYPGNWEPLTGQQAEEAAALAAKVRTAIRASLPKEVLK
ncbi:MAG TPA: HEPN domain-containing protein [bacterium]|nr:HEPN domain-containing protein [bacterium]